MSNKENYNSWAEPYHIPQDVIGAVRLKRYTDVEYFFFFGSGFLIFSILFLIPVFINLLFIIWFICLIGTVVFGFLSLFSVTPGTILRDAAKILIAGTGLYVENRRGEISFILLCSRIDRILYWYDNEDVFPTEVLDTDGVLPVSVVFEIKNGRGFTLQLRHIVESDRKKFLELLPFIKEKDVFS